MLDPVILDIFCARRHLRAAFDISERTLRTILRDNDVRTFDTPGGELRYSLADFREAIGLERHPQVPDCYAPPMS